MPDGDTANTKPDRGLIFSPAKVLSSLIDIDPRTAGVILAGLGVLAAVAIATTWKISPATAWSMALYVLGLGLVAIIIGNVVRDPVLGKVLGWFFAVIMMMVVTCFVVSALFRTSGIIKPTYCLVSFWEGCDGIEAKIAAQNAPATDADTHVPPVISGTSAAAPTGNPPTAVDTSAYRVFIQFAGLITRESVTSLNAALRNGRWQVQGPSGERTSNAAGLNEVRYGSAADRAAAETLASNITATNIGSAPITIRQMNVVRPGVLEVWVSN